MLYHARTDPDATPHTTAHTTRRELLRYGAAGSAALLVTAPTAAARSRRPRLDVDGAVLVPGDARYAEAVGRRFNQSVTHSPALVVEATSARDVQSTIQYAERRGLPVAVMATGHQPSVPIIGGILLSTRRMTATRIDTTGRTARVGAGALWGPTVKAAGKAGLAPLVGSSGGVGVVGYTVGGGLSPTMGRLHGYAADHVRRIQLVTADGRLRTATAEHDEELFWGVRGGKGNFGVVTALDFRLFDVQRLYAGALMFPGAAAAEVLGAWRDFTRTAPAAMSSSFALLRLPPLPSVPAPLRGQLVVSVRISHTDSATRGAELVKPLRAVATPLLDTVKDMPFGNFAAIHSDPTDPTSAFERGSLLRELPDPAVAKLVEVAGAASPSPLALVELRHLEGALGRAPEIASAVSHRNAAYTFLAIGIAPPPAAAPIRAYTKTAVDALQPWSTGGTYVNFLAGEDAAPKRVETAYGAGTYRRLTRLKAKMDPANTFRFNHNIPPTR